MKGGPFGDICEKSLTKPKKNCAKKILVMAGLEPMSFCLSDLEKAVVAKWQFSSVTRFSVSASLVLVPTYKIYKICQFVGLEKKEVTSIVCIFLRKAPTKNGAKNTAKSPTETIYHGYLTTVKIYH